MTESNADLPERDYRPRPAERGDTEPHGREAELEAELARLRATVTSGEWTWDSAAPGHVTLSEDLCEALKLEVTDADEEGRCEVLIEQLITLVDPRDLDGLRARIHARASRPGDFKTEVRCLVDGGPRWVSTAGAIAFEQGGTRRISGTASLVAGVAVEERARFDEETLASRERMQLVIRGARGGMYDWPDSSRDYVNIDETMIALLGYAPEEVTQTATWWRSIIHPDDLKIAEEALLRCLGGNSDYDCTYRVRFRNRGYRMVHSLASARPGPTPGHIRLTGMLLDVEDVYESRRRLEAANEQLTRFSEVLAHDLGAPLRQVEAFAEILEEDHGGALDEEIREYLRRIRHASDNGRRMIDDLLTYARTGTTELDIGAVALGPLVEEVRQTLSHDGNADHVSWSVTELPSVRADATQMRLLFQNLLSNAIKFTRGTPGARVELTCEDSGAPEVAIVVRDNGAGFEPAYATEIFEAFQRAHGASEFAGSGIGLANVARIVDRHGGRVSAEGAPGEGATFTVVLPRGE